MPSDSEIEVGITASRRYDAVVESEDEAGHLVRNAMSDAVSYMFEVFYKSPADRRKEALVTEQVERQRGRLTFRESAAGDAGAVCLTFEFDALAEAEAAAERLRGDGLHVEGPVEYSQ